MNVKLEKEKQ
jgi:chromosome segregation ATPase